MKVLKPLIFLTYLTCFGLVFPSYGYNTETIRENSTVNLSVNLSSNDPPRPTAQEIDTQSIIISQANPPANQQNTTENQASPWILVGLGTVVISAAIIAFFVLNNKKGEKPTKPFPKQKSTKNPNNHQPSDTPQTKKSETNNAKTQEKDPQNLDNSDKIDKTTRLANIDIVSELIDDLEDMDPKKRRKAIWELAQRADSRAVKPLVNIMLHADSQERSLILEALSQINSRSLQPMSKALALSLQDRNTQVRINAIRDLTKIYEFMPQIRELLLHASNDPEAEVREIADWALKQFSPLELPPDLQQKLSYDEISKEQHTYQIDINTNNHSINSKL